MFLTVCVEGMYRSWIKLYPNLDWAFTSISSFFSLEGVKQEKTASAHDNSQREGGDTRRGGGEGGRHFSQALAFLLALTDKNDNHKAPLSPKI